jgi:glycogen operon protein
MDRLSGFLQRVTAAGSALRIDPGQAWPLGATVTPAGVNFAVFSANASAIDLCLFDAAGKEELARLPLPARTGDIWHGCLADATAGLVYGLRAHGSWRPHRGHRFNPNKLLLDPYALAVTGEPTPGLPLLDHDGGRSTRSTTDSAPSMPRSVGVHDHVSVAHSHRRLGLARAGLEHSREGPLG